MKEELFVDFTDVLGESLSRTSVPEKKSDKDRFVGMFYFLLYDTSTDDLDKYNVYKIFADNDDALTNPELWSPTQRGYWWGEPLLGYYSLSSDEYVLKKHASMLCDAGVDTVIIDFSNVCVNGQESIVYDLLKVPLKNLCKTWSEIRKEGGLTPQITFLMTWSDIGAAAGFRHLYEDFYSVEKYADLWFRWEGKPLVVGSGNCADEQLRSSFTFRTAWPFYQSPDVPDAWPWMSVYPQTPGYTETNPCEIVAVSIAQNWHEGMDKKAFCYMSDRDENGNFIAQGRSFTAGGNNVLTDNPISDQYDSISGANFRQQWDRAIELDPDFVFVTGWNEWGAARFVGDDYPVIGKMCDQFCPEFSRDIEPAKSGGLGDAAYCQLKINIKRYKGNNNMTLYPSSSEGNEVSESGSDKAVRKAKSAGKGSHINNTGRNDFVSCSAKDDGDSIVFTAETKDALISASDSNWMNLYIGLRDRNGRVSQSDGWEGYTFLVNSDGISDGKTTLRKSDGGYVWSLVSDSIDVRSEDNRISVSVPKALIGITENEYSVIFKWADNIDVSGSLLNFYVDGDTIPNGRDYCVYNYGIAEDDYNEEAGTHSSGHRKNAWLPFLIALPVLALASVIAMVLVLKKSDK